VRLSKRQVVDATHELLALPESNPAGLTTRAGEQNRE
jgi:hypothetical protein